VTFQVVHKFGGTSLADADCIRRVAGIIIARPETQRAAVVSAMGGVTNSLVRAVHLAAARDAAGYAGLLSELERRHRETIASLVSDETARQLQAEIERDLADIRDVLHATTLLRRYSRETLDLDPATARSGRLACSRHT
jgi:aspartokinase/homoserine dehydrogenase 1